MSLQLRSNLIDEHLTFFIVRIQKVENNRSVVINGKLILTELWVARSLDLSLKILLDDKLAMEYETNIITWIQIQSWYAVLLSDPYQGC